MIKIKFVKIENKKYYLLNCFTGYYSSEFCKEKIKELKKEYKGVRRGSSVKDYNSKGEYVRYYRIQILEPVEN